MNSLVHAQEGDATSAEHWELRLGLSHDQFADLLSSGVFKKRLDNTFELKLVGILLMPRHIVIAGPKYAKPGSVDHRWLISVLRRYFCRASSRTPVTDSMRDVHFADHEVLREYDALESLTDWYHHHGIYRRQQTRLDPSGYVHWGRTVARRQPLVAQGSVIYPHHVAFRREDTLNSISAMQAAITLQLMHRYARSVPEALRHLALASGHILGEWPLPASRANYLVRQIEAERRVTFRTESLALLSALQSSLSESSSARLTRPQVFGTTAFYAVWEDACRVLFEKFAISQPLARPTWHVQRDSGWLSIEHDQCPDFLFRGDQCLYIGDAKYYYPFPQSRPGAPDIVKQVYYAESMPKGNKLRSVFLLPEPSVETVRYLGTARIESGSREFAATEAWGIATDLVFRGYISPSSTDAQRILLLLDSGFPQVPKHLAKSPAGV